MRDQSFRQRCGIFRLLRVVSDAAIAFRLIFRRDFQSFLLDLDLFDTSFIQHPDELVIRNFA